VNSLSNPKSFFKIFFLALFSFIIVFILLHLISYECPFYKYFHIWCSGCGGMRMIDSIIKFDFYQAFRYNPFLFILFIIGIIYFIVALIIYIKKKVFYVPSLLTIYILIGLFILFMILRNIPAFSYLIPTEV